MYGQRCKVTVSPSLFPKPVRGREELYSKTRRHSLSTVDTPSPHPKLASHSTANPAPLLCPVSRHRLTRSQRSLASEPAVSDDHTRLQRRSVGGDEGWCAAVDVDAARQAHAALLILLPAAPPPRRRPGEGCGGGRAALRAGAEAGGGGAGRVGET